MAGTDKEDRARDEGLRVRMQQEVKENVNVCDDKRKKNENNYDEKSRRSMRD